MTILLSIAGLAIYVAFICLLGHVIAFNDHFGEELPTAGANAENRRVLLARRCGDRRRTDGSSAHSGIAGYRATWPA